MAGRVLGNVGGATDWLWGDSVRRVAEKFCVEPPACVQRFKKRHRRLFNFYFWPVAEIAASHFFISTSDSELSRSCAWMRKWIRAFLGTSCELSGQARLIHFTASVWSSSAPDFLIRRPKSWKRNRKLLVSCGRMWKCAYLNLKPLPDLKVTG